MEKLNGTSGDSLRWIRLLAFSGVTVVRGRAGSSGSGVSQPSSNASRRRDSKRPSGFSVEPRPLAGAACSPVTVLSGGML